MEAKTPNYYVNVFFSGNETLEEVIETAMKQAYNQALDDALKKGIWTGRTHYEIHEDDIKSLKK